MATLKNTTINDTGFLTMPAVTTATRPTTPTAIFTNGYPVGISSNGLRLAIGTAGAYWTTYQNLPAYLTGLQCGLTINVTDSSTFTLNYPARVYLIRDTGWNAVDTTGWTSYETGKNYINGYTSITVYYKDFAAGTFTYDDNSAMYMFDFSSSVAAARKGMIEYNTNSQTLETYNGVRWNTPYVSNGLELYLDPGNQQSYSNFGTVLKDITGLGRNGLLIAGPTYTNANFGTLTYNGSSQYTQVNGMASSVAFTVQMFLKVIGNAGNYRGFCGANDGSGNDYQVGFNVDMSSASSASVTNITVEGIGITATNFLNNPSSIAFGTWFNLCVVVSSSTTTLYINGVQNVQNNRSAASTVSLSYMTYAARPVTGTSSGATYTSNITLGNALFYRSALTQAQVLQNYNAFRARYGL